MGYNKKILSEAVSELGKAKVPAKPRDITVDPMGYWNPDNQGKPVRIPGNSITMKGVPYTVYGVDNTGFAQMMYPGQDYQFQGDYVDEYPMARKGGSLPNLPKKKNSKGYSRSLTATNRLFAQNPLTKKTKSKKRKVFDPNAKYYQTGGDISVPELTELQDGGTNCPDGYKPDGEGGCILIKEVEIEEQVIYGDPAKDKQQTSLMNQLRQAKGAYQDWREGAGLRKAQLNNEGATSIEGLKRQIADYKKELAEEKKAYDKAGKALNVLKKQRPDEWKNAKLVDVMSGKGIEALRSLYSEEKISDQTFRDFYNTFGKEFDTNVVEGRGPGAQYSAREARENWMENVPEFVENVGTFAKAAALTPAMLALAPTAPLINAGSTGARVASPFMQAARTAWTNPMIKALPGSSARNAISSYYLGETLTDTPEVLRSIGQGFTGEKEWSDIAAEAGMHTFDLATAGATKNIGAGIKALKPEAQAVTKFLDRPFSTYGKKMNPVAALANNPYYKKFENFTGRMYPKVFGEVRSLNKMTPADMLKAQTVSANLWNLPGTIRSIGDDASLVADQNLSPEERLLAAGRIGRSTVMTGLGALPILKKTAPLYSKDWANKIFLADNLLKGIVYQDPTSARGLFNASRIIAKQEGGVIDSYTDTLSQREIDQLIKQGYKIEYLD